VPIAWLLADLATNHTYTYAAIPIGLIGQTRFFWRGGLFADCFEAAEGGLEATVEQRTAALNAEVLERSRIEQAVLEISRQEHQRIAHDLHDDLGQRLTCVALKAKCWRKISASARSRIDGGRGNHSAVE